MTDKTLIYVIESGAQHEGGTTQHVFLDEMLAKQKFEEMCLKAKQETVEYYERCVKQDTEDYLSDISERGKMLRKYHSSLHECINSNGTLEDTLRERLETENGYIIYCYSCDYISFRVFKDGE